MAKKKNKKKAARGERGRSRRTAGKRVVRYAVVGLGHIAQVAVLPAFANARKNSRLAALISDDPTKLRKLSRKYGVTRTYGYEQYEQCLESGEIDAVYIALPNHLHREYAVRAARAGVHVLCEKPMALSERDCGEMIEAAEQGGVRLMVAYRLHFEAANLKAIELVESGKLGEPRLFDSVFTMDVENEQDIRLRAATGGGTLWDIGIYCINAARYLFQDEPEEVFAWTASSADERFTEVEESASALMRFPGDRLATFTASFGASDLSSYRVVGTEGDLVVEPAYEYAGELRHRLTVRGRTRERTFPARDQFGAELLYFSECVLERRRPEPSGEEGLADVRVVEALYESARRGAPVRVGELVQVEHPSPEQEISRPAVEEPELVHARSSSDPS